MKSSFLLILFGLILGILLSAGIVKFFYEKEDRIIEGYHTKAEYDSLEATYNIVMDSVMGYKSIIDSIDDIEAEFEKERIVLMSRYIMSTRKIYEKNNIIRNYVPNQLDSIMSTIKY